MDGLGRRLRARAQRRRAGLPARGRGRRRGAGHRRGRARRRPARLDAAPALPRRGCSGCPSRPSPTSRSCSAPTARGWPSATAPSRCRTSTRSAARGWMARSLGLPDVPPREMLAAFDPDALPREPIRFGRPYRPPPEHPLAQSGGTVSRALEGHEARPPPPTRAGDRRAGAPARLRVREGGGQGAGLRGRRLRHRQPRHRDGPDGRRPARRTRPRRRRRSSPRGCGSRSATARPSGSTPRSSPATA